MSVVRVRMPGCKVASALIRTLAEGVDVRMGKRSGLDFRRWFFATPGVSGIITQDSPIQVMFIIPRPVDCGISYKVSDGNLVKLHLYGET